MTGFLTKIKSTTNPPNNKNYDLKPFISDNNTSKCTITVVRKTPTIPTVLEYQKGHFNLWTQT